MKPQQVALLNALFLCAALQAQGHAAVSLSALSCEHLQNPIGIGNLQPRLSWKLVSSRAGEVQTAYHVRAASSAGALRAGAPDLWDSGKVASGQSILVPWGGKPLTSRSQVFWQVRIWDKDGQPSPWSDTTSFELGLVNPSSDWKGQWLTSDLPRFDIEQSALAQASWINAGSAANQSAAVRLTLNLPARVKVSSAIIDVAADGLISFYANGRPTLQGSSSHTAPFHASFANQLLPGKNVIGIGSAAVRNFRGSGGRNAIAARIVIELEQGGHLEFSTDASWKAAVAPSGNWAAADLDDAPWPDATVLGPYRTEDLAENASGALGPGRYFRRVFTVKGPVARARLYSTALGVYEASLNGKRVNDHQLDPGWTDYAQRVMVQTTDVTKLLTPGRNALGVLLGDGWFAGRVGWMGLCQYARISRSPLCNAQLEITYADGSAEIVATDNSWRTGSGELVGSDMQLGEVLDARKRTAWDQPSFDDAAWNAPVIAADLRVPLVPQLGVPVRKLMELAPQSISRFGSAWLVDLGQNMVGHVRLSAKGPAGTSITVRHGEALNPDGTLYTENLRPAISLDTFTLRGDSKPEVFEPHFTFHGFRYLEIIGYPGTLKAEAVRGIVVGSDLPPAGAFECSDTNVNRLYQNIVWSQRGNFLSVPTDCPQRDERMGWMGDAQVFAPTAAHLADVSSFFTKWMVDVNDAQGSNGEFSTVSPRANQNNSWPVWGDAGVVIPWEMYLAYGDKDFLANNYEHMARWVDYSRRSSGPNLLRYGGVGDHLAPIPGRAGPGGAAPATGAGTMTNAASGRGSGFGRGGGFGPGASSTAVVDTAYFARSAWIVSRSAALLGKTEDAARYDQLFQDIAAAFNQAFVHPDGTIQAGTQTTYSLALLFDLLPESLRDAAARHLADDVEAQGHLTSGFVGVGLLNPALCAIGRSDLAWQLLFNDTYPSWLFSVKHGATTIWERWDGWTPEKGFQASSMNSFNHYSLGSVGAWLYSGAAGIQLDPSHPGYKHLRLQPQFTSRLSYLKASLESPYGLISSSWHATRHEMIYDVTIPPNSSALLLLPVPPQQVRQSGKSLAVGIAPVTTLALSAGTYRFAFPSGSISNRPSQTAAR